MGPWIKLVIPATALLVWGGFVAWQIQWGASSSVVLWTPDTARTEPQSRRDARLFREELQTHCLTGIDFQKQPVTECAAQLHKQIQAECSFLEPFRLIIDDALPTDRLISLNLKDLPITEALDYLAYYGPGKVQYGEDRLVAISALDAPCLIPEPPYEKGWIQISEAYLPLTKQSGRTDLRSYFENALGNLPPGVIIAFDPKERLVWVEAPYDEMEMIYETFKWSFPPPVPWTQRLAQQWYLVINPFPTTPADPFHFGEP